MTRSTYHSSVTTNSCIPTILIRTMTKPCNHLSQALLFTENRYGTDFRCATQHNK